MDAQSPQMQAQPERTPLAAKIFRQPGETDEEWRRRRNRERAARDRQRHPDRFRAQYAKRRAKYVSKPGHVPYSPRTFRQPGETEEEWKRRSNRERKLRYKQRHPERVLAQKRGQYHRRRDAISERRKQRHYEAIPRVSSEELDYLRAHIRDAISEKDIKCLDCGAILLRLAGHLEYHLKREPDKTEEDLYREKWGYDRTTPLCAKEEVEKVRKEAKRRNWGARLVNFRFEEGRRRDGVSRTLRAEARMNRSETMRHADFPTRWKRTPDGQVVTDARIALLRLQGRRVEEIALLVGMNSGSVSVRLRNIGFGGRDIAFDRGAVVTGTCIVNLCQDFNLTRVEISNLLGKRYDWASGRTGPANLCRPLSAEMAREVLALRTKLKDEYRQTAPTAKGGRPRLLLPSERASLRERYPLLLRDLQLLKRFLEGKGRGATMGIVWNWLCENRRGVRRGPDGKRQRIESHEQIQTLFYWPRFYEWMHEDVLLGHAWLPMDIALDFCSAEFRAGTETIARIVRAAPKK